ncbi:MAG: ribonuclease P protein component [Deltaproteobacteria bacterium]|nr:ribonuclease P protein component [Deltaproteobacteria bacterium]
MVQVKKERFPSENRLRKRWQFLEIQNSGQKTVSRFFIGLAITQDSDKTIRIGIAASKRYANAVGRNRIKRLIREAFRREIIKLPEGCNLVIVPKKFAKNQKSSLIFEDLSSLGNQISSLMGAN